MEPENFNHFSQLFVVDTTVLITGSGDSLVKLWDVETGKEIYNLPHKVPVKSVEFAEGDKQFLVLTDNVMGYSSTVSIYALNDGRRIFSHHSHITAFTYLHSNSHTPTSSTASSS
jgi:WD40 repeat protein